MELKYKKVPLTPIDTAWLRMEDPTNLMMITGVYIFDEPLDFEALKDIIRRRLLKFDRFTQRVVQPGNPLRPPYWETDPHFDLSSHVRRIALPPPGNQEALQELVSDFMSTQLDFNRPLWQFHLIDNYGDGCAMMVRLHHCIADGIALIQVMLSMTEDGPEPTPEEEAGLNLKKKRRSGGVLGPAKKVRKIAESMVHEGLETLEISGAQGSAYGVTPPSSRSGCRSLPT